MRTEMMEKPASYPREYFEVHLTTAEKKQLKKMAAEENLGLGAFVRWKFFGVKPTKKVKKSKEKSNV